MKKAIIILILVLVSSLVSATNFLTNLEFYLECEDNAASTTVTDSHRDYSFTMSVNTNTVTSAGFFNNGFNIAQTEYFNRVTSDFSSNTTGTSCFWKYGNGGGGGSYIHSYYQDSTHGYNQNIADPNMNILYRVNGATIIKNAPTVGGGAAGWDYFCMVQNLTNLAFFVNGSLVESLESYSWINATSGNAEVIYGEYPSSHDGGYAGIMDEIGFWSKAFTAQEIMELFTIYTDGGGYANFGGGSPAGGIEINASIQNATVFGIVNMSTLGNNIYFNLSINDTTASCVINDSSYTLLSGSVGASSWDWINNTLLDTGLYYIKADCNRTDLSVNGTKYIYFEVDFIEPAITVPQKLDDNNTIIFNASLNTEINFSDQREIYSIGVQFINSTGQYKDIYNASNIAEANYWLNISTDISGSGRLYARECDSHTNVLISEIDRIDTNAGLKFVIKDYPLFFEDDFIFIYPENAGSYDKAKTKFKQDRYTFEFKKKIGFDYEESFIVESNHKIDISPLQTYKGHLIINGLDYWVDFETLEGKKVSISRINENKVRVTVIGLEGSRVEFNSLGELNCISEMWEVADVVPVETYSNRILSGSSGLFTLSITPNPLVFSTVSATLYYNNTAYPAGAVSNFSVSATTPAPITGNYENISFFWGLTVDGAQTNLSIHSHNVTYWGVDQCTTYPTIGANFSIFDYNSSSWIGADGNPFYMEGLLNVVPRGTSLSRSVSFPKAAKHNSTSVCIYPDWANFSIDFTEQYTKATYEDLDYIANSELINSSTRYYNLYMIPTISTTAITCTVVDETDIALTGYTIEVYKYSISGNNYTFVDSKTAGAEGKALFNLDVSTDQYQFRVKDLSGKLVYTEPAQQLIETEYTFRIVLGTNPEYIKLSLNQLSIQLNAYRSNKTFIVEWQDIQPTTQALIFNITKLNGSSSLISSTVSPDASGSLSYVIAESTINVSASYMATVWLVSSNDNNTYYYDSKTIDYKKGWDIFAGEALFMSFIFVGTMAFIGFAFSATTGLLLCIFGIIILFSLGLYQIALTSLVGIIINLIIILVKSENR